MVRAKAKAAKAAKRGSSSRSSRSSKGAVTVRRNGVTKKLHGAAAQAVLNSRKRKPRASKGTLLANRRRKRNAIGEVVAGTILTRQVERELSKQRGLKLNGRRRSSNGRRRNSVPAGIASLHQDFLGRPVRHTDVMIAPTNAPRDLAKLGDLHKLISETETFKFSPGEAVLAANARGDLFVVGDVVIESNGNFGSLLQVEYIAKKNHLDDKTITYFHKFGDEGGKRPTLRSDKDGHFQIAGGDYTIESEGITN
jgi:hypothetical protein